MRITKDHKKPSISALKLALSLATPLAVILPTSSFAFSNYITDIQTYCTSAGKTAINVTCDTCHATAPGSMNGSSTKTSMGMGYPGNKASFCVAAAPTPTPTPTPPPVVKPPVPTPVPGTVPGKRWWHDHGKGGSTAPGKGFDDDNRVSAPKKGGDD